MRFLSGRRSGGRIQTRSRPGAGRPPQCSRRRRAADCRVRRGARRLEPEVVLVKDASLGEIDPRRGPAASTANGRTPIRADCEGAVLSGWTDASSTGRPGRVRAGLAHGSARECRRRPGRSRECDRGPRSGCRRACTRGRRWPCRADPPFLRSASRCASSRRGRSLPRPRWRTPRTRLGARRVPQFACSVTMGSPSVPPPHRGSGACPPAKAMERHWFRSETTASPSGAGAAIRERKAGPGRGPGTWRAGE